MTKKFRRLSAMFLLISMGAFLLFFGMPNFGRIHQNRLNSNLLRAVYHQDVLAATALLKQGANVNTKDDNPLVNVLSRIKNEGDAESGHTLLMLACVDVKVPFVQLLLQHGADVNLKDGNGTTALMWSAMGHNSQIVALLLNKGALVNVADPEGSTALMEAAKRGDLGIVTQLLKHGAEINGRDKHSHTALAWAIHNQFPQVSAFLKQRGANE